MEKKLEEKDKEIEMWFEISIENLNERNKWKRKYEKEIREKGLIMENLKLGNEMNLLILQYLKDLIEDSD